MRMVYFASTLVNIKVKNQSIDWFPTKKLSETIWWGFLYHVTFSPSRSMRCETNKPPAMRVRIERLYQKNSKRDTIKVFKPIVKSEKEKNHGTKDIVYHTAKWHCKVSHCVHLSIDEKSFIIQYQ